MYGDKDKYSYYISYISPEAQHHQFNSQSPKSEKWLNLPHPPLLLSAMNNVLLSFTPEASILGSSRPPMKILGGGQTFWLVFSKGN